MLAVSPAVAMWINIAFMAGGAVVAGLPQGSQASTYAGLATAIFGALNTALHSVSSSQPGPLAK